MKREAEIKSKRSKQWVDELQDKLREFRREKISWTNEAVALRGQVKDAQVCFVVSSENGCVFNLDLRLLWLRARSYSMTPDTRERFCHPLYELCNLMSTSS